MVELVKMAIHATLHLPGVLIGIVAGTLVLGWLHVTSFGIWAWLFLISAAYLGYAGWHSIFKRTSLFRE
jgi:hypothetical protein